MRPHRTAEPQVASLVLEALNLLRHVITSRNLARSAEKIQSWAKYGVDFTPENPTRCLHALKVLHSAHCGRLAGGRGNICQHPEEDHAARRGEAIRGSFSRRHRGGDEHRCARKAASLGADGARVRG